MRIRKRFLSLSAAISTPPSSDLLVGNHYHRQQRVQHQEVHPNENIQHVPSSSDHTTQIGAQPTTWTSSGEPSHLNNTKIFKELESERMKGLTKTQDTTTGKESMLCEEGNYHDLVLKGWLVPVKKKRGSFGRRLNNDIVAHVQDNEMEAKVKKNDKSVAMGSKKKEKILREGVIMEGSRCSRVNGRGWRCSQETLVGYSLCEHHLGKGRLGSMTSVRGRSQTVALKEQHNDDDDDDDEEDDEEFKDWDVESMSSLEGTKTIPRTKSFDTNSIRAKGFKGSDRGDTSCMYTHGGIGVEAHTSGEDENQDLIFAGVERTRDAREKSFGQGNTGKGKQSFATGKEKFVKDFAKLTIKDRMDNCGKTYKESQEDQNGDMPG
ncbi:hypothetical protein L1987_50953 [Smallanthus sonchifolius]|uniref:Uncharacterized protein n=1 Tax=Smallanthus sonchifolius TaxID=185202 RepID=A0ACB9EQ26_9ASTR|nr:hypothetical protein L1987_50953 [Smallanthus sonchifolius]